MSNVKKWFRGVRGRLLVLGFAPFITMLIIGAIATIGINELGSRLEHILGVSGKISRDQAQMDASIHALGRWLWISYGFAENPVEREKFLKRAKEALSSFEEASRGFSTLAHDEFDHELVAVVSKEWPLAKAGAEEAIQSLEKFQEKDREQVRRLMQTKLPPHLVPLTLAIGKAQLGAKANDLEEAKEVAQRMAMTKLAILLISSLTAIILFAFSIFSAHRLSKALAGLAQKVNESGDQVNATAGQMALAADELSAASSEQAAAVQETAACIEEISAMVNKSAENAVESERCSSDSKAAAEKGRDIVGRMSLSMGSISASNEQLAVAVDESNRKFTEISKLIQEIDTKTKVINDIVFQTRLLSFNASVEAARAGEHGKGFSVVAEEVGKLAQMSGNAAVEIRSLLDESLKNVESIVQETQSTVGALMNKSRANVEEGKMVVHECEAMLSGIVASSCDVLQRVSGIAMAGKEQSAGVSEISKAIQRIDQSTVVGVDLARQYADGGNLLESRVKDLRVVSSDLFRVIEGHPSVVKFTWGDVYRLGVDNMDDQHRILIEKMNVLASEVENALAGVHASVLQAFKDLAGYTQRHFKEEEAYMESIRYSGLSGHREIHRRLLETVMEFGTKIEAGSYDGAALMDFLNNWLMRHILGADMKYAKFSRAKAPTSQRQLRSVG